MCEQKYRKLFLQALKASLTATTVLWKESFPLSLWVDLFNLAGQHNVLPMIYESVCRSEAFKHADAQSSQFLFQVKQQAMMLVVLQTQKNAEFYNIYQALIDAGVTPLVMKGLVCRSVYPNPEARGSGDEDVLIKPEQFDQAHEILLKRGMQLAYPEVGTNHDHEVEYRRGCCSIEVHKTLMARRSAYYGDWNDWFFKEVFEHPIHIKIDEKDIWTLNHTDHLLFLICHTFKHFLSTGVGIRQLCDICMYANIYGEQIKWSHIVDACGRIRAEEFCVAIFNIGEKYLNFDVEKSHYPESWRIMGRTVDEGMLLEDILNAGAFGKSTEGQMHSGMVTMNAYAAQKNGKKQHILRTVFPPYAIMANSVSYSYVQKKPYLLPVAWLSRIVRYRNRTAIDTIKVGKQRVEILRMYKIID